MKTDVIDFICCYGKQNPRGNVTKYILHTHVQHLKDCNQ